MFQASGQGVYFGQGKNIKEVFGRDKVMRKQVFGSVTCISRNCRQLSPATGMKCAVFLASWTWPWKERNILWETKSLLRIWVLFLGIVSSRYVYSLLDCPINLRKELVQLSNDGSEFLANIRGTVHLHGRHGLGDEKISERWSMDGRADGEGFCKDRSGWEEKSTIKAPVSPDTYIGLSWN
jgi:hypothetical protein